MLVHREYWSREIYCGFSESPPFPSEMVWIISRVFRDCCLLKIHTHVDITSFPGQSVSMEVSNWLRSPWKYSGNFWWFEIYTQCRWGRRKYDLFTNELDTWKFWSDEIRNVECSAIQTQITLPSCDVLKSRDSISYWYARVCSNSRHNQVFYKLRNIITRTKVL